MIGFTIAVVLYVLGAYLSWEVAKLAKSMGGPGSKVNMAYHVFAWPVVVMNDMYQDIKEKYARG